MKNMYGLRLATCTQDISCRQLTAPVGMEPWRCHNHLLTWIVRNSLLFPLNEL